ncbi:hypothetical protein HNR23_003264 [Nocardiopsis mwathae]|uniref:Uncharacterized protein n=1 Tax=Nocardiopsis mwathae TaxID=1472723 RepID=A0A7W9YJH2_9ACTN|nr:hypothetical protein [Nocardiopsis mwathae]MBB6173204.1 hypothetical protein [Nocardiopsis mwathae]
MNAAARTRARTTTSTRRKGPRRHRPYAAAPPPATAPDRARLTGPSAYAPPATPRGRTLRPLPAPELARRPSPHPALGAWSGRESARRTYRAYKRRILNETAGRTRALFPIWEQAPFSCAVIAALLLAKALGLLG